MTDKLPTIDIHGKEYVQVKDRISYFNEKYPNGIIQTQLLSEPNADMVVVRAKITPDMEKPERFFTGHSQAKWADKSSFVNATSAMENAETSSVGRALAMMGIGIIESVSSADEVKKAVESQPAVSATEKKSTEYESGRNKYCELHQKELKERNFDGQVYYDHRMQIEGVWNKCAGAGYKADKPFTQPIPERDINEEDLVNF